MRKSELQEWDRGRTSSRPRAQDAAAGAEQADLAASGGPVGAAGVLALQRTAGNAAVTQALGGQRHDHGPPVQRALENDARNYGNVPGSLMQPRDQDQQRLEDVFPRDGSGNFQQFPDPVTLGSALTRPLDRLLQRIRRDDPETEELGPAPWVSGINPQRDRDRAYRRNCVDAVRSFLASWSGNPTVSVGVVGTTDEHLEAGGTERTATWLATRWKTDDIEGPDGQPTEDVWNRVGTRVLNQGHGASAVVVFRRRESGNVHAICAVNFQNHVIWVDPQLGRISVAGPLYNGTSFMTITLTPQFTPVAAPPAPATALTL